jgi:hypothetical protein
VPDRAIRVTIAFVLFAVAHFVLPGSAAAARLYVLGSILLLTVSLRFSAIYAVLGISTNYRSSSDPLETHDKEAAPAVSPPKRPRLAGAQRLR